MRSTSTSVPTGREEPLNVLIVDDHDTVRSLVAQLVTLWGMAPVTASDGMVALQELSAHRISLVLTDYRMPVFNGLELAARIHADDSTIPVIILSGEEGESLIEEAIRHGVFAWVQKPFDPHHLRAIVMTALQGQSTNHTDRTNTGQLSTVPARAVA
jgi:DNA-binding NtrC family response regulator